MTTQKDIDEQIRKDVRIFNDKIYDGYPIPEPDKLMSRFRRAVRSVSNEKTTHNLAYVKTLAKKRPDELSFVEVGMIVNVIFMAKPSDVFDSFDEYVDVGAELQNLNVEYNKAIKEMEEKMKKKHATLSSLAGITGNSTQFKSGLRAEA